MASKKKQRKWMRHALYDAYQMAGALGAGGKALDNFYAAASGRKPPHDDVLPIYLPLWETELRAAFSFMMNTRNSTAIPGTT